MKIKDVDCKILGTGIYGHPEYKKLQTENEELKRKLGRIKTFTKDNQDKCNMCFNSYQVVDEALTGKE